MFSAEYREQARDRLVEKARGDAAIVAAAAVGSSAVGGDRWSDLDLTFAVAEGTMIADVLERWTADVLAEFGAAVLFDLPFQSTIYRVFLFPGALQVDLSFTPAADFGARTPRWALLFGTEVERPQTPPPSPASLFGLGVHHAVRAHICIERGKLWQAEYWLHQLRDEGMTLACLRLGIEPSHGRGFDALPANVQDRFARSLVNQISAASLRPALAIATSLLVEEAAHFPEIDARIAPMLADIRACEQT